MANPPSAVGAVIAVCVIFLFVVVYLSIMIPYCCSLRKTMQYVPAEKSIFPSWLVWLFLLPGLGLIVSWMLVPFGIPIGLRNVVSDNPTAVRDANTLKKIGLAKQIFPTLSFLANLIAISFAFHVGLNHSVSPVDSATVAMSFLLPFLLCSIPNFTLWIVYWVKTKKFRERYFEHQAHSQSCVVAPTIQTNTVCSNHVKQNDEKNTVKRPVFLTTWLVYLAICNVAGFLIAIFVNQNALFDGAVSLPSWMHSVSILLAAVNLFAVILLWMWKKMGFFLAIATHAVALIMVCMRLELLQKISAAGAAGASVGVFFGVLFTFLSIAILYFAMKPVWDKFD